MSVNISSKKRRGELLLEDAAIFAPQYPQWTGSASSENHRCATCGKITPEPGLCDLCQVIFKLGMAYVAERVAGMPLEDADQTLPAVGGAAGEPSS